MTEPDNPPLNLIKQPASIGHEDVVKELATLKIELDRYARKTIGQPLLNDIGDNDRGTCALHPDSLMAVLIPFLNWEDQNGQAYRAFVDPKHVVGTNIKGHPENVPPEEVVNRIERYATYFGSRDNALYVWYKPLGLFIAHEGKHRVAFMRSHDQPAIAAWVQEAGYPAPSRITIIEPSDDRDEWLAMLDGRYIQVLRRPNLARKILDAYGVSTARWQNIDHLPDEKMVRLAIYERRLHRPARTRKEIDRTLDLQALLARMAKDSQEQYFHCHELGPYRLDWKRNILAVACLLIAGGLFVMFNHEWVIRAGIGLLGVATGMILSHEVLRFKGPKKLRNPNTLDRSHL
ncbi:hypothetical protein [Halomonas sp. HAL1]|uniref:hypothetical protein n=1 Tax=Halomonas sp. HAL1 TaxID=550984 RepID=UPI00022D2B00|nr:hypothetical protein [Halomonas sp. HAL1]EHA15242.1 hypothetical protein HAL1_12024 [Halomonas sp. HAL1]WKV95092.1 hypothetical protein Q3Y66_20585 [Halomonas sp. HAL1]